MKLSEEMIERSGAGIDKRDIELRLWASEVAKLEKLDQSDELDSLSVRLINALEENARLNEQIKEMDKDWKACYAALKEAEARASG